MNETLVDWKDRIRRVMKDFEEEYNHISHMAMKTKLDSDEELQRFAEMNELRYTLSFFENNLPGIFIEKEIIGGGNGREYCTIHFTFDEDWWG